jgi:hypothetical protein
MKGTFEPDGPLWEHVNGMSYPTYIASSSIDGKTACRYIWSSPARKTALTFGAREGLRRPNPAINAPSVPATAAEQGCALEQEPAARKTSSSCSGRSAPTHSQPGRSSSTQHPKE